MCDPCSGRLTSLPGLSLPQVRTRVHNLWQLCEGTACGPADLLPSPLCILTRQQRCARLQNCSRGAYSQGCMRHLESAAYKSCSPSA